MRLERFEALLKGNNGIKISDDLVVYNDFEVYNYQTGESRFYKNVGELWKRDDEARAIIEEAEEFYLDWSGGRGAGGGGAGGTMGGGFKGAGGGRPAKSETLFPAELNLKTARNSVDKVLGRFNKKYGDADREYAIAVDEDGFAKQHIKGGRHSVGISGDAGDTIIHNHPSGSNFSDADLHNFANTQIKSIVATSSNKDTKGIYRITKTDKFKAKEFDKAIRKAQWDITKYPDYNSGADWWLRTNQKKYGYKYTATGRTGTAKKTTAKKTTTKKATPPKSTAKPTVKKSTPKTTKPKETKPVTTKKTTTKPSTSKKPAVTPAKRTGNKRAKK